MSKYPHHLFLRGKSWYYQCQGKVVALHTRDKAVAIEKRDVLMKEVNYRGVEAVFKQSPVFGAVCVEWWNNKRMLLTREVSRDRYKYYMNSVILKTPFIDKKIDSINEDDIEAWIYGDLKDRVGSNTILIYLTVLSNIFKFAMRKRYVIYNPVSTVKRPKYVRPTPDPYTLDECQLIIANSPPLYQQFFITKFFSGLRISELCGLMWNDIDFVRNTISVRRSMLNCIVDAPKNVYSQREVQMLPDVRTALLSQRGVSLGRSEFVFIDEHRQPIHSGNFAKRVWNGLIQKCGLRFRPFRNTRQSFITIALDAGANMLHVSKTVGHADNSMIFKHYQGYIQNEQDHLKMSAVMVSTPPTTTVLDEVAK
jgi:integrase